jgi:hypothetical protein
VFSIWNRRRPAPSTSRRTRPRLEVLEDRTTPATLYVNTLSQAIDSVDGETIRKNCDAPCRITAGLICCTLRYFFSRLNMAVSPRPEQHPEPIH